MVYNFGPLIPGKPTKLASPLSTSAGESNRFAALKPKPKPTPKPAPKAKPVSQTGVMIPAYAYKDGKPVKQESVDMATRINDAIVNRSLPPKKDPSTDLGTGSIETKTAPTTPTGDSGGGGGGSSAAEKPLDVTLGQEDMQAAQNAADALRLFQENQAKAQLTTALSAIDRSALDQYATIANDYAARGLARSGGKLMTEQKAQDEVSRTKAEANQAVTDFLNELRLTGNLEQAKTNLGKSAAFQDYINNNYGNPGA